MAEQGMKTAPVVAASEPEKVGRAGFVPSLPHNGPVRVPLSLPTTPLPQTTPSGKHVCAEQLSTVSSRQWEFPPPCPSCPTLSSR